MAVKIFNGLVILSLLYVVGLLIYSLFFEEEKDYRKILSCIVIIACFIINMVRRMKNARKAAMPEIKEIAEKDNTNQIRPQLSDDEAEFETISGRVIAFTPPAGEHYTDEQDYHAAEIYQGYSYREADEEESVADMFFGIAADFDCDVSEENMRDVLESRYGKGEQFRYERVNHRIFDIRVEFLSNETRYISYLKEFAEYDLLSCELIMKASGRESIVADFEKMVNSSR